jgi:hypothetical protein
MLKKMALALCGVALLAAAFALPASAQGQVAKVNGKWVAHGTFTHITRDQAPPPSPEIIDIWNNWGGYGNDWDDYWWCNYYWGPCWWWGSTGYVIAGPTSPIGMSVWIAQPFAVQANSHATTVQVPVQWAGSGTKGFEISIYTDNAGVPGTALATQQKVANTTFPKCCSVKDAVTAKFSPGVALTAKTPYWVVVDTVPAADTATYDVWAFAGNAVTAANTGGSGWSESQVTSYEPALNVSGTTP